MLEPSLEGLPGTGSVPTGWFVCAGEGFWLGFGFGLVFCCIPRDTSAPLLGFIYPSDFLGAFFSFFPSFFFLLFFFPSFFFLLFFSIPVPGTENRGQISQTALPPSFSTELCCSQGGNAARKEPFGERPSAPGTCCFLEFINYFLPVPSDLGIHSLGSKGFWDRGREEWVHPGAWAAVGSQRWFLFGLGVWEKLLGETKNGFSQPSQHSIPSFCLDSYLESSVDLLVLLSPSQSPLLQICLAQTQKVLA